jgi:flagellum-specific ATP synthase
MAAYRDKEDLIAIGAYQPGGDPTVDLAIEKRAEINAFLRQPVTEPSDLAEADTRLAELSGSLVQAPADTLPPDPAVDGPKTQDMLEFSAHQHGAVA